MQLGATFPIHEIGNDPAAIRAWAQAVEDLGFSHIASYDHVICADTTNRPDYGKPYTIETPFHEAFTLFAFLAACTRRVGLVPAIVQLPLRQTVLVAKQAAEVDILSGGRLRLGVGLGRYEIEYEAMNQDFTNRGKRMEEQVAVLRALWTQPAVNFQGAWHKISDAGLNPLPVQRPIPLWFGGGYRTDVTLRRIARLSDGFLWYLPAHSTVELPAAEPAPFVERLHTFTREAGRETASVPLEGQMSVARGSPDDWRRIQAVWRKLGAKYLVLNAMEAGFTSVEQHIERLRVAKQALAS